MNILLVEDNPPDARLFTIMIREKATVHHDITITQTLKESVEVLNASDFDAAFVDLNLPDSNGLETLKSVLECKPDLPVIVLTGMDNDELGSEAIVQGAQDYLPKDESTPTILDRCLRHGIERKKLMVKLRLETQKAQEMDKELQEFREMQNLKDMMQSSDSAEQVTDFGKIDIHELIPEYQHVLERSVAEQIHKTEDAHTPLLQNLVEKLGELKALPKDIIQLHLKTIDELMQQQNEIPEGVYVEEGRMLLLQTMGELASYYHGNCSQN